MKVTFTYKNYKGETRQRVVIPIQIQFTATEYHPTIQWILIAHDAEKNDIRQFAVSDISDWQQSQY